MHANVKTVQEQTNFFKKINLYSTNDSHLINFPVYISTKKQSITFVYAETKIQTKIEMKWEVLKSKRTNALLWTGCNSKVILKLHCKSTYLFLLRFFLWCILCFFHNVNCCFEQWIVTNIRFNWMNMTVCTPANNMKVWYKKLEKSLERSVKQQLLIAEKKT